MTFQKRYPLTLTEILVAPVIFRENLPLLRDLPLASANGMRDLAEREGFSYGAVRTALSRLRASGQLETTRDDRGVIRYRMGPSFRSVSVAVQGRFARPEGYLLAVFSFATENTREREMTRAILKAHGFQKLAQNVYINGQIDTSGLEKVIQKHGLTRHFFLFRCADPSEPAQVNRLVDLFDLKGRTALLTRFERHLHAFLEAPNLSGDERARRFFVTGPIHYRITYADEPPLPARCFPANYPLERLSSYLEKLSHSLSRSLIDYYLRVNT